MAYSSETIVTPIAERARHQDEERPEHPPESTQAAQDVNGP